MKWLFNSLILSAVLIGFVWWLRSNQPERAAVAPTEPQLVAGDGSPRADDTLSTDGIHRAIDPSDDGGLEGRPAPKRSMAVQTDPVPRSDIDAELLYNTEEDALYATGRELLALWHVPEAIDVFETLAEKSPEDTRALLGLVESYAHPMVLREEKAEEALDSARRALLSAGKDTTRLTVYRELFIEDRPSEALKALSTNPQAQGAAMELLASRAYLDAGEPARAEEILTDVIAGAEDSGEALELLVYASAMQGKFDDAESHARDLAAVHPEEPFPYVLLSRTSLLRGQVEDAVAFCNNALQLDPRYVPAIVARAHLYVVDGEYDAARVSFEKLVLFGDDALSSIAVEGRGYVDFLNGRFDEASEACDDATRLALAAGSPKRALLLAYRHIDNLCGLGRTKDAETVVENWISRYGRVPDQLGRIRIGVSDGNSTEARTLLEHVIRDPEWRSWAHVLGFDPVAVRALSFIGDGKNEDALRVLEGRDESSRHGIEFPFHRDPVLYVQSIFYLAEASLARGELDAARQRYAEFLSYWGDAEWELPAVDRARLKLEELTPEQSGSSG
jgi:tetratricopeptide (TPR) repeat protein